MKTKKISFRVNNQEKSLEVEAGESLLELLRNRLGLTGVKKVVL